MLWYVIIVFSCCLIRTEATKESARIIIVGAGASGIAAASRLIENGFNNVTILEAQNRIGGRVYTTEFGGYAVDLGGQWVHGEEDNAAYELAWPLGLLEHSPGYSAEFHSSSGPSISKDTGNTLMELYMNITGSEIPDDYLNKSSGEYYKLKFDEYFKAHSEITGVQAKTLMVMLNLFDMVNHAADSWDNISVNREEKECKGDFLINWKGRGYSTILDILMKKYPNPTDELPVMNNTILNSAVSTINYNITGDPVRVVTADGVKYFADHVIVTTSIGFLKANHYTMFNPSLPERKYKAIQRAQLGSVTKIVLLYDDPWWVASDGDGVQVFHFYWTEKDKEILANDPMKSWWLGVVMASSIENKPNLLLLWVAGPGARKSEILPEYIVFSHAKSLLHQFLGTTHNLTEPTRMLRTKWFTNKYFRGTWSYRTPQFERSGSKITDLSEPIMKAEDPVVLFAGEATNPIHPSTVHGAISTGWREADRLIHFYSTGKWDSEK